MDLKLIEVKRSNRAFQLYLKFKLIVLNLKNKKKLTKEEIKKFEDTVFLTYKKTSFFRIWFLYGLIKNHSILTLITHLYNSIFFKQDPNFDDDERVNNSVQSNNNFDSTDNDGVNKNKLGIQKKYKINLNNFNKKKQITCVIPTYNAGLDFKYVLASLKEQISEINEILIIDSGSTDETLNIAKKFGCRIIQIHKSKFSHSETRNSAIKEVKTPFAFLTVQDCVLSSKKTLSAIQDIIISNNLSAVTIPQVPRMDADEYSIVTTYYHNKTFYDFERSYFKIFNNLGDKSNQRYHTQLDNVSCLYRVEDLRNTFFRGEFAEDVNIAIDLIQKKKLIARANIYPVIHSHTRHWLYHLKRSYVESKAISHNRKVLKNLNNIDALKTLKYFYFTLIFFRLFKYRDLKFIFEPIKGGKFNKKYFVILIFAALNKYKIFYEFRKKFLSYELLRIVYGVILAEELAKFLNDDYVDIKRSLGENV